MSTSWSGNRHRAIHDRQCKGVICTLGFPEGSVGKVARLIDALGGDTCSAKTLMQRLGLRHRPSFLDAYLHPALDAGVVAMTDPEHPRSPRQRYRLTPRGRRLLADRP